ncbi:MAG: dephospho-CoA kinase [Actinomycetota bacterium]
MIVVGLTGGIGAGKSTVSTLLAKRGAAIVDADQIARDLQAPGTPVVEAMAERFGPQILDAEGALIRPEVAKIVFTDEQALQDLNGIVHPAMQAEIQAQIDAHRDTDRVVVLDFPLLGENPRKGLAATIVVDVPYDVAVERAVARGMDEADVRNRIESQMRREDRLAMATHVIDNSGDTVDLVSRIDRVWEQIRALPPTEAADLGQPVDATRVAWVFGYGSLVSAASLARTIGRLAKPGKDFHPATLRGYGRRWNYGVGHVTASWTLDDGTEVVDGTIVALGLVEAADETVNGVLASLTADELADLDHRERDYDQVEVTESVHVGDDVDLAGLPVLVYVPRTSATARHEAARDAGTGGVRRTYWDLVIDAFGVLSERTGHDEVQRFHDTTPPPDVPVVDLAAS